MKTESRARFVDRRYENSSADLAQISEGCFEFGGNRSVNTDRRCEGFAEFPGASPEEGVSRGRAPDFTFLFQSKQT